MWTEVDYSNLKAGTYIPVYHYNAKTGFLTLTQAQISYKDVVGTDGSKIPTAYFSTGALNPGGKACDGTTDNVCLNPDQPFDSAQDVTGLKETEYKEENMLGYNEQEIQNAQNNVAEADGTATDVAHDALNTVVNQEVAAISEEQKVIDDLNATMGEMAGETGETVEQVATDNQITASDLTATTPEATEEQVADAQEPTTTPDTSVVTE